MDQITKDDAVIAAAALWLGTAPEKIRGTEYLRGQVELIADLFGHDYDADPDKEALAESIIEMTASLDTYPKNW